MNDYKRITTRDENGNIHIRVEKGEFASMIRQIAQVEDKIESGEWVTKEECHKLCREFYEQGRFDALADKMATQKAKYKVGDTVWCKELAPIISDGPLTLRYEPFEHRVLQVYYNQGRITYKVKRLYSHTGAYIINEERLFETKEAALARIQQLGVEE